VSLSNREWKKKYLASEKGIAVTKAYLARPEVKSRINELRRIRRQRPDVILQEKEAFHDYYQTPEGRAVKDSWAKANRKKSMKSLGPIVCPKCGKDGTFIKSMLVNVVNGHEYPSHYQVSHGVNGFCYLGTDNTMSLEFRKILL
jgi:ssDNA-binding Zn-finger/Zn-ribbon topoisomerase 1